MIRLRDVHPRDDNPMNFVHDVPVPHLRQQLAVVDPPKPGGEFASKPRIFIHQPRFFILCQILEIPDNVAVLFHARKVIDDFPLPLLVVAQ